MKERGQTWRSESDVNPRLKAAVGRVCGRAGPSILDNKLVVQYEVFNQSSIGIGVLRGRAPPSAVPVKIATNYIKWSCVAHGIEYSGEVR